VAKFHLGGSIAENKSDEKARRRSGLETDLRTCRFSKVRKITK